MTHLYEDRSNTAEYLRWSLCEKDILRGYKQILQFYTCTPNVGEKKSKIVLQWVHPFSDISMQDAQYSVEHPVSSLYKYLRAAKVSLYQESWDLRKLLLKRGLFGDSRLCTLTFRELSFSCLTYTFKEIK